MIMTMKYIFELEIRSADVIMQRTVLQGISIRPSLCQSVCLSQLARYVSDS